MNLLKNILYLYLVISLILINNNRNGNVARQNIKCCKTGILKLVRKISALPRDRSNNIFINGKGVRMYKINFKNMFFPVKFDNVITIRTHKKIYTNEMSRMRNMTRLINDIITEPKIYR